MFSQRGSELTVMKHTTYGCIYGVSGSTSLEEKKISRFRGSVKPFQHFAFISPISLNGMLCLMVSDLPCGNPTLHEARFFFNAFILMHICTCKIYCAAVMHMQDPDMFYKRTAPINFPEKVKKNNRNHLLQNGSNSG